MYLPTAATGNNLSLATFGPSGELMGFFYPNIDFAQNVREGMFAVWLGKEHGGRLEWCFSDLWERSQRLESGSNILVTELVHRELDLTVTVTDFLPTGDHALVRDFQVKGKAISGRVVLYHYFNLSLSDVDRRNAIHWLPERRVMVQQFREVVVAFAASTPFGVQCSNVVPGGESAVKKAMRDGRIHGGDQCMGDVDFAVGFELTPESEANVTMVLAGAASREKAVADAARLSAAAPEALKATAINRCSEILRQAGPCPAIDYSTAYERAVLSLMDLYDSSTGTFIAAPEFDPYYSLSGGYGYSWPRDAAVSALVTASLGFDEHVDRFFQWSAETQLKDGHWYQRYWANRVEAPSWCVREDEIQLDQTCAVVHAAGVYARRLGDRRGDFVSRFRPMIRAAAAAIEKHLEPSGLHKQAADLWECAYGSFAYTNGAVIAAFREAKEVWGIEVPDIDHLREVLVQRFYQESTGRWFRNVNANGRIDETGDSSVLGLIEPWEVFDLDSEEGLSMALSVVEFVSNTLAVDVGGKKAILRFQNESYMGGGPGCVNTLWLAQCLLKLVPKLDAVKREGFVRQARVYIETALDHTNPVGQLPELIPFMRNLPYWAAPHGWASSLFIQCMQMLGDKENAVLTGTSSEHDGFVVGR